MTSPRLVLLTDRRRCTEVGRTLVSTVTAAVEGGPIDVVMREKDLPRAARARLAASLCEVLRPRGGRLLVASDAALAHQVGADGVHLAAADPTPALAFDLVGRSCHDVGELRAAEGEDLDYATLSPVLPSTSKPGYGPCLGLDGLADVVAACHIPVLALGGIDASSARACLAVGASGVAVMGAIMGSTDPASVTAGILRSLDLPHRVTEAGA